MASVSSDSRGNRLVQFIDADGKRRSIRIGKIPMTAAREMTRHVHALNVAVISAQPIGRETAEWLGKVGDKLHAKLANAGLVVAREKVAVLPLLGDFLADFTSRFAGAKASTLSTIRVAAARLTVYFGREAPLDSITPGQADNWLTWMKLEKKYAGPTIGRTIKHAKRFFTAAVRLKILAESPFAHLRSRKQTNPARNEFISQETAYKVIDALPDVEWRLIFALARFGGLRTPSETLALTWADVDWENDRFEVTSSKTGKRLVPIFAELRPYLDAAFHAAADGAVNVIGRRRNSAQRWGVLLERILRRAGITRWERIFHNLRASRQTELTAIYSIGTVCRWLGNSVEVADAHYLSALESDFKRASSCGALHNPMHQSDANRHKLAHTSTVTFAETLEIAGNAKEHPEACKSQGDAEQSPKSNEIPPLSGSALRIAQQSDLSIMDRPNSGNSPKNRLLQKDDVISGLIPDRDGIADQRGINDLRAFVAERLALIGDPNVIAGEIEDAVAGEIRSWAIRNGWSEWAGWAWRMDTERKVNKLIVE
jgi:integrase